MSLDVYKVGTVQSEHEGGFKSPLDVYRVIIDGKTYNVHVGCKDEVFNFEATIYVYTANGRYLKPSSPTHKNVAHLFTIARDVGWVKDIKEIDGE